MSVRQELEVRLEPGLESERRIVRALAAVLSENFRRPERRALLDSLDLDVGLVPDGAEPFTISFLGSRIRIYPGLLEGCGLILHGSERDLLRLTRVPLARGRPVPWSSEAIRLAGALLKGRVRITGPEARSLAPLRLVQALSGEYRDCPF